MNFHDEFLRLVPQSVNDNEAGNQLSFEQSDFLRLNLKTFLH